MPSVETTSAMFAGIARRYDRINRILSLGRDKHWRAGMFHSIPAEGVHEVLDLCAGTLAVSIAALRAFPNARITAVDACEDMLEEGKKRLTIGQRGRMEIRCEDVMTASFPGKGFDLIACGWGLRNVSDSSALMARSASLLRPGGRFVVIDCFRPIHRFSRWALVLLRVLLPVLGKCFARESAPYRYLHDSIRGFMSDEECLEKFKAGGLDVTSPRRFMGGLVSIVEGVKGEG